MVLGLGLAVLALGACGSSSPAESSLEPTTPDDSADGATTTTLVALPSTSETATTATTTTPTTTTTTTTTLPQGTGEAWVKVEAPIDVQAFAGTDEQLWVIGYTDGLPRLFRTDDLREWAEIDLAEMGLRLQGDAQIGGLWNKVMATSDNDQALFALGTPPVQGLSAEAVSGDIWMLRMAGDRVELLSPEQSGVDQRLSGPKSFRLSYFADGISFDGDLVIVAGANWWLPFDTGDSDLASIVLAADGTFSTASVDEAKVFRPSDTAATDDTMIVFDVAGPGENSLLTRLSDDGLTWRPGGSIVAEGASGIQSSAAVGIDGTAVVATRVDYPDAATSFEFWATQDGISWEAVEVPTTLERPEAVSIERVGDELILVIGNIFVETELWRSDNGTEWEPITTVGDTPNRAGRTTVWNGRLVLDDGFGIWVSPPVGAAGG